MFRRHQLHQMLGAEAGIDAIQIEGPEVVMANDQIQLSMKSEGKPVNNSEKKAWWFWE